jgi:hypothetical protein
MVVSLVYSGIVAGLQVPVMQVLLLVVPVMQVLLVVMLLVMQVLLVVMLLVMQVLLVVMLLVVRYYYLLLLCCSSCLQRDHLFPHRCWSLEPRLDLYNILSFSY